MSNLTLFQELENLLRPHSQFCTEDGVLLKNSIVEAALQLRPDLLKLILNHDKLKANFFTDVDGMLVFDKVRVDPHAPEAYGATVTYDIPLDSGRAQGAIDRRLHPNKATT